MQIDAEVGDMTFNSNNPVWLHRELDRCTAGRKPRRWIVAFSGGIDSTVLLHALSKAQMTSEIVAVHINHGLHEAADEWATQAQQFAATLGIAFQVRNVVVARDAGVSLEAAAREARYAAFREFLVSGDCLLSAHNQDDQGETLLLNLMRGSGAAGLAGIGRCRPFGPGLLLRPLLEVPRKDIESYAATHGLQWLEDPSNTDIRFDRNFLRHEIIPALAVRWPAVSSRLKRSAELQGEASQLLIELADIDLATVGSPGRLSISRMRELSLPRQRNVLRRAIQLCALPGAPATRLSQIIDELMPARRDAQPSVFWAGAEARRFRDEIFIAHALPEAIEAVAGKLSTDGGACPLSPGMGSLTLVATESAGISPTLATQGLHVRRRSGGESICPAGHKQRKKLKALFQENAIVPWMRPRLPLLYAGDRLVAIGDLWVAEDCLETPGFIVKWDARPTLK